jgi:beta-glucosidase-like glycosyl hydrolase
VRRLTDAARAAIGADDVLVLIDQEGGRVRG